jgi:hypothetical protein
MVDATLSTDDSVRSRYSSLVITYTKYPAQAMGRLTPEDVRVSLLPCPH